jgi:SPP1 gp7 family putative phage head morphogenesis protein
LQLVRYITATTTQELLPLLKSHAFFPKQYGIETGDASEAGDAVKLRPLPPEVNQKLDWLSRRFGGVNKTATRLSRLAVQKNLAATDTQLVENIQRAIGINIRPILQSDSIRDALREAEAANIDLIKSIPAQYLEKVKYKLEQNYATGSRWEDLADALEDAGDVTESRIKLIARDQTSKMNGSFNRVRQTSIGINKYRWQTAEDERVRPTHRANDQKVFSWDNPPSETGHPGEDINCRCVAIPEFDLDDD